MDLSITVNGMKFPNPFLLGSGPPGTNARVIAKSYEAGWGGAVAKTVSLESAKVVNVPATESCDPPAQVKLLALRTSSLFPIVPSKFGSTSSGKSKRNIQITS